MIPAGTLAATPLARLFPRTTNETNFGAEVGAGVARGLNLVGLSSGEHIRLEINGTRQQQAGIPSSSTSWGTSKAEMPRPGVDGLRWRWERRFARRANG
jgi:hypothetical protein